MTPLSQQLSICAAMCFLAAACQDSGPSEAAAQKSPDASKPAQAPQAAKPAPPVVKEANYTWLSNIAPKPEVEALAARFSAPDGFKRVSVAPGSFGHWLRHLPIRKDRDTVHDFSGNPIAAPGAAVVLLDVGERDLQQCADMAIRMHAEFLWTTAKKDSIAYHFTSGDRSAWKDWRLGEYFKIKGNKVTRRRGGPKMDTYGEFRRYLNHTFRYAGTRSLAKDSDPVSPSGLLMAGDFFVQPGGPGHAVMILDVAADEKGRLAALIGQGFMPAQDLHVVKGAGANVLDEVWFILPRATQTLDTPSWKPFKREEARRFRHVL